MSQQDTPRKPERTRGWEIALGVLLTAALHIAAAAVLAGIGAVANVLDATDAETVLLIPFFFIGGAQAVYVIPAALIARRRGRNGIVLGLVIGASLTLLANTACFGMLFSNGIH